MHAKKNSKNVLFPYILRGYKQSFAGILAPPIVYLMRFRTIPTSFKKTSLIATIRHNGKHEHSTFFCDFKIMFYDNNIYDRKKIRLRKLNLKTLIMNLDQRNDLMGIRVVLNTDVTFIHIK